MAESNSLSLVTPTDGVPTTTSLIVSEGIGAQHASVIRLVRDNQGDFEEFGGVGFEIQPFETPGGTQSRTIAVLNREQAMLLMTYMRNTPIVRQFKKNLIRAFLELERRLATPAELSRAEILTMALQAEEERLALEAKTRELEPKATAYDAFMDAMSCDGRKEQVAAGPSLRSESDEHGRNFAGARPGIRRGVEVAGGSGPAGLPSADAGCLDQSRSGGFGPVAPHRVQNKRAVQGVNLAIVPTLGYIGIAGIKQAPAVLPTPAGALTRTSFSTKERG